MHALYLIQESNIYKHAIINPRCVISHSLNFRLNAKIQVISILSYYKRNSQVVSFVIILSLLQ